MPKIEIILRRLMLENQITMGEAMSLSAAVAFATSDELVDGRLYAAFARKYGTENLETLAALAPDVVVKG